LINQGKLEWVYHFRIETSINDLFKYDCTDLWLKDGSPSLKMHFGQTFITPQEFDVLVDEVEFRIDYMSNDLNEKPNVMETIFGQRKKTKIPEGTIPPEFYSETGSDFMHRSKRMFAVTDYFDDTGKFINNFG